MAYLMSLANAKVNDGSRNLVAQVLRDFCSPEVKTNEGTVRGSVPTWASLFRGLVVASRILAISTRPHCNLGEENLVSQKTAYWSALAAFSLGGIVVDQLICLSFDFFFCFQLSLSIFVFCCIVDTFVS